MRRFGPPAARSRRCVQYSVVGDGPDGWRLCFGAGGRVMSASYRPPER
jgi:hypothetical protein